MSGKFFMDSLWSISRLGKAFANLLIFNLSCHNSPKLLLVMISIATLCKKRYLNRAENDLFIFVSNGLCRRKKKREFCKTAKKHLNAHISALPSKLRQSYAIEKWRNVCSFTHRKALFQCYNPITIQGASNTSKRGKKQQYLVQN